MFKKLFGWSNSPVKIDDAVRYFFDFSLYILSQNGEGPFNLSESEKYDFRSLYIAQKGMEDYGVWCFSKIELESTNFTNYHLEHKTSFKIGMCCEPVLKMNSSLVMEVKQHLSNII